MKFVVSKNVLEVAVKNLLRVIPSKPALPILTDIEFHVMEANKRAIMMASDGEVFIESHIDLDECEGEGSFTVQATMLANMLSEVKEQPLTVYATTESEKQSFTVEYQDGEAYCSMGNANEYPHLYALEESPRVVIVDDDSFKNALDTTAFAAARDEFCSVMCGVYFTSKGGTEATLVASDGHVLMKQTIDVDATGAPFGVIIPSRVVAILSKMIDPDDKLNIEIYGSRTTIDSMSFNLTFRQIEGKYPNWEGIIPNSFTRVLKADRLQLISALKAVAPFAPDSSNMIIMRYDVGNLTIEGSDNDFAAGAERRVAVEPIMFGQTTDPMTIGFKAKQLITALSKLGGPFVAINLNEPDKAGVFEPEVEGDDNPTQMALVMPMLVNE